MSLTKVEDILATEYRLVLLGLVIVMLTYIFTIYGITMRARIKVFAGTHMKNFKDLH